MMKVNNALQVPGFHSEWFWFNWKTEKNPDVVAYMERNYPATCKSNDTKGRCMRASMMT